MSLNRLVVRIDNSDHNDERWLKYSASEPLIDAAERRPNVIFILTDGPIMMVSLRRKNL